MLQKISDHDLIQTISHFHETKEIEKFRTAAGLWIMENARIRYSLAEDELSEIFLRFYEKADKCLDYFIRKNYTDLPAYLSVYTKHLVQNIFRSRRQAYTEEYLQLWQEERVNKDTEELIHHSSTSRMQDWLKEISLMGRIIISLRYNLPLGEEELRILYKCLRKQNKQIKTFHEEYEEKIRICRERRESLLLNLNNCNRKIYNSLDVYPILAKKRKKKILNKLLNTHIVYSIKEVSDLLSLSRHQTGRLYRSSLEIIKEKMEQQETVSIAA